jgi:iron-sulfur cluster repair protein YtfE (RIC family)
MLRDPNLVPLSRQHQHALALCVRIERATAADPVAWQEEIEQHFRQEILFHFAAEEEVVFPRARRFPELAGLVEELAAEHAQLRGWFERAARRDLSFAEIQSFGRALSAHIRKEERQLFETLQKRASAEEMEQIGQLLAKALEAASLACALPVRKIAP